MRNGIKTILLEDRSKSDEVKALDAMAENICEDELSLHSTKGKVLNGQC
jgi:hypothetical protein